NAEVQPPLDGSRASDGLASAKAAETGRFPSSSSPHRETGGGRSSRSRRSGTRRVMNLADLPQPPRRFLGSEIALRRSKQLEANHELADRSRAKQRRIEVRVKMLRSRWRVAKRLLMKTHRVRKRRLEQVVVSRGQSFEYIAERIPLGAAQRAERPDMPAADEQRLERPGRPERNDHGKRLILADDALAMRSLALEIVAQQTRAALLRVPFERCALARRLVGKVV